MSFFFIRYSFGNQPLWVHSTNKPEDIPPCQCGAPRVFEFQVNRNLNI